MTISNFMNRYLKYNIEDIFQEINRYIFEASSVDTDHVYIDGTKIEANGNKYSWVWKKACLTNRDRLFKKITVLLNGLNQDLVLESLQYETRDVYEIDYLECILRDFICRNNISKNDFVHGIGKRNQRIKKDMINLINTSIN